MNTPSEPSQRIDFFARLLVERLETITDDAEDLSDNQLGLRLDLRCLKRLQGKRF